MVWFFFFLLKTIQFRVPLTDDLTDNKTSEWFQVPPPVAAAADHFISKLSQTVIIAVTLKYAHIV